MGNVVPMPMATGGLTRRDPRRVALFQRGPGKDLQGSEIDEALEWCEIYGANPFVKDIYFFVFDAKDPAKRRVVPVLGIGLYRKIAARTGNYLPDDEPPAFRYEEKLKGPDNPLGIIDCTVRLKVYRHGDWHVVSERLRWDERAPIKEEYESYDWIETGETWADSGKPKKKKVGKGKAVKTIEKGKQNWATMPETMLAKCVEAAAIRKAFPNETAGSYVAEELDWQTIEGTAEDITNRYESEQRMLAIGGPSITLDWCDGEPLDYVPLGKVHDRVSAWITAEENAGKASLFKARNTVGLREFWAHDKAAALDIRKQIDAAIKAEA